MKKKMPKIHLNYTYLISTSFLFFSFQSNKHPLEILIKQSIFQMATVGQKKGENSSIIAAEPKIN